MELIEERTLGLGWLETCRRILAHGVDETYDGIATKELALLTLAVAEPDPDDEVIAALADPDWLDWMDANFTARRRRRARRRAQLRARACATTRGRDQIAWVVERLQADPATRSATITTLQPLSDTSYIPCVSMLDFWRVGGPLELVVYAHSLDFGKKAYGNLVELARLQHEVAGEIGVPVGRLVIHAKSAHVYEPELELMRSLSSEHGR